MSYSHSKPIKDREHILREIDFCNKASTYGTILSGVQTAGIGALVASIPR